MSQEYAAFDQSSIEPVDDEPGFSPFVPFYDDIARYTNRVRFGGGERWMMPWEFTGWRDEQQSWSKTAYIHGGLNPTPTYRFKGPDVLAFLSFFCVNSFASFSVGGMKHLISVDEEGDVTSHGVAMRTAEDEVWTYWMINLSFAARATAARWDMEFTDFTGERFLLQIAGPRSLEILEETLRKDLHDIRFFHHRDTSYQDVPLRIARLGMAGTLAYELHGDLAHSKRIFDAVFQTGKAYGMRRLGWYAYMQQHTINGFPQASYHLAAKLPGRDNRGNITGSAGPEATGYHNPIELGWSSSIVLDHEFVGRSALGPLLATPKRTMVTLEWNSEDVQAVFASQFTDEEPLAQFDLANDIAADLRSRLHQDKVLDADGAQIGLSMGRMYSVQYRRMISLSTLDVAHAAEGAEVYVLWGEHGQRQMRLRATVARYPYADRARNNDFDVESIPRLRDA